MSRYVFPLQWIGETGVRKSLWDAESDGGCHYPMLGEKMDLLQEMAEPKAFTWTAEKSSTRQQSESQVSSLAD